MTTTGVYLTENETMFEKTEMQCSLEAAQRMAIKTLIYLDEHCPSGVQDGNGIEDIRDCLSILEKSRELMIQHAEDVRDMLEAKCAELTKKEE